MKSRVSIKDMFLIAFLLFSHNAAAQNWHSIPAETINIYELIGDTSKVHNASRDEFQISDFIRFKDYKLYLKSTKRDSSNAFYLSQLPDSSIFRDKRLYVEYLEDKKYDVYPVVGVSWESAVNYCKWKTIKDNSSEEFSFFYRLPTYVEWFIASNYLDKQKIKNDLNYKYSDWTMQDYYENMFDFSWEFIRMNFINPSKINYGDEFSYPILRRKLVTGNSFLFQKKSKRAFQRVFYANRGYRYVAFRLVKKEVNDSNKK